MKSKAINHSIGFCLKEHGYEEEYQYMSGETDHVRFAQHIPLLIETHNKVCEYEI